MARQITLVGGLLATVDDDNFDRLSAYRWYAHRVAGSLTVYAKAIEAGTTLYMHKLVLVVDAGFFVDHRDRDGLNNMRSNLRAVTPSENMSSWVRDLERLNLHTVHRALRSGEVRTYFYHRPTKTRLLGLPGEARFDATLARLNGEQ